MYISWDKELLSKLYIRKISQVLTPDQILFWFIETKYYESKVYIFNAFNVNLFSFICNWSIKTILWKRGYRINEDENWIKLIINYSEETIYLQRVDVLISLVEDRH